MKRITIMAALLGSFHFASAQVGIGTPSPANSSQLDIVANNKGVLIPRIALTSTAVFAPVEGTEVESLLVYNTATAGDVTPGFYYWFNNKWERIVNQTQLEEAISDITDLQGDVDKIIALLKVAFPSNNLVNPAVTGDTQGGGMVFTPGTTPTIEYVYFDGTDYVKKDITDDIIDIIKGAESKTLLVQTTDGTKQYYVSETYLTANNGTAPSQATVNGWTTAPTGVYEIDVVGGVINNIEEILTTNTTIVINEGETNEQTFITVEEYIQYIASQADGNVIYKNIADEGDPDEWVFQYWDADANGGDGDYVTINLTDLVGAAQSQTTIVTYQGSQYYLSETYVLAGGEMDPANWTAVPAGAILIDAVEGVVNNFNEFINSTVTGGGSNYTTVEEYIQYISENAMQGGVTRIVLTGGQASFERWNDTTNSWTPVNNSAFETIVQANETETVIGKSTDNSAYAQVSTDPKATDKIVYEYLAENATNYMDITGDVAWSIENNTDVQNAIEDIVNNLLNQGGNVYFTRTNIAAGTPAGQLAIPAFSFYTINPTTGVKEIVDITDVVVNAITNANQTQITAIKNTLGDKITNDTSIITGDTYNNKVVRKGIFSTTIAADTATTSGITLDTEASEIISITVKYGSGLIANVTDLEIDAAGDVVNFNIGTGNMYQVLGSTDIDAEVIIEFAEL